MPGAVQGDGNEAAGKVVREFAEQEFPDRLPQRQADEPLLPVLQLVQERLERSPLLESVRNYQLFDETDRAKAIHALTDDRIGTVEAPE
jgi:hypothetical protein